MPGGERPCNLRGLGGLVQRGLVPRVLVSCGGAGAPPSGPGGWPRLLKPAVARAGAFGPLGERLPAEATRRAAKTLVYGGRMCDSFKDSQMPRHLISDAHEWINEIPTAQAGVPFKCRSTANSELARTRGIRLSN